MRYRSLTTLIRGRRLAAVFVILAFLASGCGSGRISAAEIESIVEAMELKTGSVVADVGAGEGDWAVQLARRVGTEGHVWATEVDQDEIDSIEGKVVDASLENITVVLGSQTSSGLPASCCDAILLRMVYHHFVEPEAMRSSLFEALRPDGLIAVIDIVPQTSWRDLPEVPDRGGHGIEAADLIREMSSAGFELVSREDRWNGDEDRYCIVFRR